VFTSLVVAVLGLLQYFGISDSSKFLRGIIPSAGARISSTLGNAAFLSTYLLINFFLALYLWFKKTDKKRWFYFGIAAVNFLATVLTGTRGALIGLAASVLMYLGLSFGKGLFRQKNYKLITIICLLGILLIGGVLAARNSSVVKNNYWLGRITDINLQTATAQTRFISRQPGLESFKQNILLGIGQENFNLAFDKYFTPELYKYTGDEVWFSRAHNKLVDLTVMTGIFGLLIYLAIFAWVYAMLFRIFKKRR